MNPHSFSKWPTAGNQWPEQAAGCNPGSMDDFRSQWTTQKKVWVCHRESPNERQLGHDIKPKQESVINYMCFLYLRFVIWHDGMFLCMDFDDVEVWECWQGRMQIGTSLIQWVWLVSILEDLVWCAWSSQDLVWPFHSLDAHWPMLLMENGKDPDKTGSGWVAGAWLKQLLWRCFSSVSYHLRFCMTLGVSHIH